VQPSDSLATLPAVSERQNQASLVEHSRSRSTSSSGDEHNSSTSHRASDYLQPLVSGASSGTTGHPIKYLQLLNSSSSTTSSTPQLSAVRRHDRDDRRRRPDYSPLVCDGNDSSGTSLATSAGAQQQRDDSQRPVVRSAYSPIRPGPSPLYGRHAVTAERRVRSMNCDDTG